MKYLQTADAQAVNIIEMRAAKTQMSSERCHKALRSEYLWQLTTNGGARFLYFRDGPRRLVIVGASFKVKEKKFHIEIDRADKLRAEYLQLKEGMVT